MKRGKIMYAEDVNFWQTGKSSPDVWIERAKKLIAALGCRVLAEGFGSDADGHAAYMLAFEARGDRFKIIWPVLPSKSGKEIAARVQAATMLYHYVKSVCLFAVVVGTRSAFFAHLMLSDGRMASQVADPDELLTTIPQMLLLSG
jgi:hypothetical protein